MSGLADPKAFAEEWQAAWNRHDLDAVVAHYAEDAVFSSPLAARMFPESGGVLRGRAALREYWAAAFERNPQLHFELTTLHAGVDLLLIGFRTHDGIDRCEVLRLRNGLAVEGWGTFAVG
jgi:ketosteroid isomerase-like protein